MLKVQEFQELTGLEYLKADIACKHDKAYEKEHWNDRIAYFDTLDLDDPKIYKTASNPIGLRAGIAAYKTTMAGQPSGYMISQDASSSGMQLLSLLVSDPLSFKLCGGDESILDSYTALYVAMTGTMIDRTMVKKAIMTALYGSTATPEAVFGDEIDEFYSTMETMAPGAWQLNLGLQELWGDVQGNTYDWTMPDNFYCCIETSEKVYVNFKFLERDYQIVKEVQSRPTFHKGLGPNVIHSIDGLIVREMFRRCQFNSGAVTRVIELITQGGKYGTDGKSAEKVKLLWNLYEESGFLSARILDYLHRDTLGLVNVVTIAKLIQSMPLKPFELVTVHDCFRSHPNYGNDVRRQYNTILADINDSNMLQFLAKQIGGPKVRTRKLGKIDREVILNANYLLA